MLMPLNLENLESMCTDECRSSLESLRTTVLGACDPDEDVMVFDRHAYPGNYSSFLESSVGRSLEVLTKLSQQHLTLIATFTSWT